MNTYAKYTANVFVARCPEKQEKGTTITLTTARGTEHECIVFNLVYEKDGYYYYSIVRADGFNVQEWAKRKAERWGGAAVNAEAKSESWWNKSNEGKDFLSLGEPIKVGHHSEKRHRALIERNARRMDNAVEAQKKAEQYAAKAEYWKRKENVINLSMPESVEYYEFLYEQAVANHEGIKNGFIPKEHSYSLTYAKKHVNEVEKKLEIAKKLWN